MQAQLVLLISAALAAFAPARGNPVASSQPGAIPVQENFDEARFYGKWYGVAVATTCPWMKQHKERFTVGTVTVGPGKTTDEISITSTRLRQGLCSQVSADFEKTDVPGKITYYNPKWKAQVENYVARTDYEKYAFLVMRKNSSHGLTITVKLYGRHPAPGQDLVDSFRQFALDLGIPEDSIFLLNNKGECVPPKTDNEPQRTRRAALADEEGSADGALQTFGAKREDDCLAPMNPGPCLGMLIRYFYNTSSQMCEGFVYGGCLGSRNNFVSERECLQTCRTEAACRLPIAAGGPCKAAFWAFDAQRGKCVTFTGCGANANKFYLEKECKEYCGVLPDGDEGFLHLGPQ